MVTIRDDLRHGDYVDITVCVASMEQSDRGKRSLVAQVVDQSGQSIPLVIWEKHRQVANKLTTGKTYRLEHVGVKSWPGQPVRLHTGPQLNVVPIEASEQTILHMSDSHLGYHLRPESGGKVMPWDDDIGCLSRFQTGIEKACAENVDTVVHTGDIFDHAVDSTALDTLERGIRRLSNEDIPFYYLLGNHESPDGNALLEQLSSEGHAIPLEGALDGHDVGEITLYGLDNRSSTWWQSPDVHFRPSNTSFTVLCLHQTVRPPYTKQNPDCEMSTVLDTVAARLKPDLVVLGDLHTSFSRSIGGMPAHYAGPTGRISYDYKDSDPTVNLFEFSGSGISHERIGI
jgi:DNA repair exonuclease SbcCD nuclease subunit